jgi:hypothetical protein
LTSNIAVVRIGTRVPGLHEVGAGGLDNAGRNAQIKHSARIADSHIEDNHDDDFIGGGDLEHLRPRLPPANAEGELDDRPPRVGQ